MMSDSWVRFSHAFRTAPKRASNPATDDLGTLPLEGIAKGSGDTYAYGINDSGQVVVRLTSA